MTNENGHGEAVDGRHNGAGGYPSDEPPTALDGPANGPGAALDGPGEAAASAASLTGWPAASQAGAVAAFGYLDTLLDDSRAPEQLDRLDEPAEATARRAATALLEMCQPWTQTVSRVNKHLTRIFQHHDGQLTTPVIVGPFEIISVCPHHLMPITYRAVVGYQPVHSGNPDKGVAVIGLSKLVRVARELAKRPVMQEDLTLDIAGVLHREHNRLIDIDAIDSDGSIVQLEGTHTCMSCRGSLSGNMARTVTQRAYCELDSSHIFALVNNLMARR